MRIPILKARLGSNNRKLRKNKLRTWRETIILRKLPTFLRTFGKNEIFCSFMNVNYFIFIIFVSIILWSLILFQIIKELKTGLNWRNFEVLFQNEGKNNYAIHSWIWVFIIFSTMAFWLRKQFFAKILNLIWELKCLLIEKANGL